MPVVEEVLEKPIKHTTDNVTHTAVVHWHAERKEKKKLRIELC
jgi:hypothetical protein